MGLPVVWGVGLFNIRGVAAALAASVLAVAWSTAQAQPKPAQSSELGWIPAPRGGPLDDERALVAGTMTDGLPVYVCSARYNGGVHPGVTGGLVKGCAIGHGGREIQVTGYSIFVGRARWVPASGGQIPANAVQGGNESDDRILYVCRARYRHGIVAGKIRGDLGGCSFAKSGQEIMVKSYDVLVR